MANSEAGSAYVSIIPSMKGFQRKLGAGVEKAMKAVGKATAAGAAGAVAALGAVTKASMDAFGGFEQLSGGVEKIFDQMDTSRVFADANNAWRELNMSANDYMESINRTGSMFAQTMGDERGYEVARKGMLAIADFASGTGADLENLNEKFAMISRSTSSYQSIADQFSGILPATSRDFLAQAQAAGLLSGEYESLTDVPMAEYQQALVGMLQRGTEQLGLQGNTADETLHTLTGSVAGLRSAWSDWLAELGKDDADLDAATSKLMDALQAAVENVVPRLAQVGGSLVQALPSLLDGAAETLAPVLSDALQGAWGTAVESLASVGIDVSWVPDAISRLQGVGEALMSAAPGILAVAAAIEAASIATAVAKGVSALAKSLETVRAAMGMVKSVQGLGAVLSTLAGGPLMIIIPAIAAAAAALAWFFTQTDEGRVALGNILAAAQPVIAMVQGTLVPLVQGAAQAIGAAAVMVGQLVSTVLVAAFTVAGAVIGGALTAIQGAFTTVLGVVQVAVGVFVGLFTGNWQMASDGATAIVDGLVATVTGLMNALLGTAAGVLNGIAGLFSSVWNGILGVVSGIVQGIVGAVGGAMGEAKDTVSGALDAIAGFFSGLRLELPHIKLPHFRMSGGFSIDPPSVPSLGVEWYGSGGLFDGASLVGIGERGTELAWPSYGPYLDKYGAAIADHMDGRGGPAIDYARLGREVALAIIDAGPTFSVDGRAFGKLVRAHE